MEKDYKELHPQIWEKGRIKGEYWYEKGYSEEHCSNNLHKYNPYLPEGINSSEGDYEKANAYSEGAYEGYNEAKEYDYKCCFKEQEDEDL